MPPCLSPDQIAVLLDGQWTATDLEASESHLGECERCRDEFLQQAQIADAAEWQQAAREMLPLPDSDQALIDELKALKSKMEDDDDSPDVDLAKVFTGKSLNGSLGDVDLADPRRRKMPDVPGFAILGELGRGGMGVVYKARQIGHDRIVALKMILAGLQASPEDLGRFRDEAEAISRLRHPHIVQIFDVGQVDDRLYFVLEFIEGGTLAEKIRGRPLPPRSAAQLLETLARAMHYAHERGIVHRDLKPANVMLHGRKAFADIPEDVDRLPEEWDFRRCMPKITDFGLAKLLDRSTGGGHTASGDVVGTPSYMAPEQAQGGSHTVGPVTDVYSLGGLLYEMLTGRPPFQGATPMDTLFQVHTQEPIPPRKLVRDIPPNLEAICLKCLRKRPNERYATAEELAEDLRLFLDGMPVRTGGAISRWLGLRSLRRTASSWATAALVLLLAVAAGAGLVAMWLRGEDRREIAQSQETAAANARRENVRLRVAAAQSDCERGEVARGMLQMVSLLSEVESQSDSRDWRDALQLNLAAWAPTVPRLKWMSLEPQNAARLSRVGQDLWFIGRDGRMMHGPLGNAKVSRLADSDGAESFVISTDETACAAIVDHSLRWWDLQSGEIRANVPGMNNPRGLEISSDGNSLLFVADEDGKPTLRFMNWDVSARKVQGEVAGLQPAAWAWRPGTNQAIIVGADGGLELKRYRPTREEVNAGKIAARVTSLSWFSDGTAVAFGCSDGVVRFWTHPETELPEPSPIRANAIGPVLVAVGRSGILVTAGADRRAKVWRIATGELIAEIPHPAAIAQISFPEGGDSFLTRDDQGTARIWDLPSGFEIAAIPWSRSGGCRVAMGPDGRMLVSNPVGATGPSMLFRVDSAPGFKANVLASELSGRFAAFHPSGDLVMASDGRLERIDRAGLASGMPPGWSRKVWSQPIARTEGVITTIAASRDGRLILTGTDHGAINFWDGDTGAHRSISLAHAGAVLAAAFRSDGQAVLIGGNDAGNGGEARVWSLTQEGNPSSVLLKHPIPVVAVEWESDGTTVRTIDARHFVRRWNCSTGERVDPVGSVTPDAWITAVSPDHTRVVAVGKDGMPRLISSNADRSPSVTMNTYADFRTAAFSADGRLLITGWRDGVRLWDGRLGAAVGPNLPLADLQNLQFGNDERTVLGWGDSGIRLWKLTGVEFESAVMWRTWIRHHTGMDRSDDGAIRFLEGKEWRSTENGTPK
jgi:WD40 repeat protein